MKARQERPGARSGRSGERDESRKRDRPNPSCVAAEQQSSSPAIATRPLKLGIMSTVEVDAVIVGGGPCGLALALGLLQLGYTVRVVEKEDAADLQKQDWSKAYSYRVDCLGISLLKRLDVFDKLAAVGVKSEGFSGTKWLPDGTLQVLPTRTLGSVGYWLQRPHLIRLLSDSLPATNKVQGVVERIDFGRSNATVHISSETISIIKAKKFVFGCDGIHSVVRSTMCEMDDSFGIRKIDCPSAGLTFRATLITPPEDFVPGQTYLVKGKTGAAFSLLPFAGGPGEPRPIACARHPDYRLFQFDTAEEFYAAIDEEFPQLEVRQRMSLESATAWCTTDGSAFPKPRWAGKAAKVVNGEVVVVLVGDALKCFPPDLGQGVNSGMADVAAVLDMMEELKKNGGNPEVRDKTIEALDKELTKEAESVCRLLPIGMPYQYTLPHTIHKFAFFAGFMTRYFLSKLSETATRITGGLMSNLFYAPAILEIQDDPPLKYSTILWHHRRNTLALFSTGIAFAGIGWANFGRKS